MSISGRKKAAHLKPRTIALALLLASSAVAAGALGAPRVSAQDPTPTASFVNVTPGSTTIPSGAGGVVVEGKGGGTCTFALSDIEASTVYFIGQHLPTWTEISPQPGCQELSGYEQEVDDIVGYVESNDAADASHYWLGFMLDEEPGFGFAAGEMLDLNSFVENEMSYTLGDWPWYSAEISSDGTWDTTSVSADEYTFNELIGDSTPAPQIANDTMSGYTNDRVAMLPYYVILVTWSTYYPTPYDTESYAVGQINGYTWEFTGGVYFDNEYVPS